VRLFGCICVKKQPFNPHLQVANCGFMAIFALIRLKNHCGADVSNNDVTLRLVQNTPCAKIYNQWSLKDEYGSH